MSVATNVPLFLFALPAGALADIIDRRKLLILAQVFMLALTVLLLAQTVNGAVSPLTLLVLIFLNSRSHAKRPDEISRADPFRLILARDGLRRYAGSKRKGKTGTASDELTELRYKPAHQRWSPTSRGLALSSG